MVQQCARLTFSPQWGDEMSLFDQITIPDRMIEQGFLVLSSDRKPLAWFDSRLAAVSFCLSSSSFSSDKIILTDAVTAKPLGIFCRGERVTQ